jgi:RNA polymerase sigma-70 factor (ECF subfamily)
VERVYDYAARSLRNAHLAEEVTQEVFYRAFRGLATCRNDAAFAGWLFSIARFAVIDVIRARQRGSESLEHAHDPLDPAPLPDEAALGAERRDELLAVRERCLSPSERELFDLLLADLSTPEIATALGRRQGAVRTAQWRLLAKLRTCFGVPPQQKGGHHVAF